MKVRGKGPLVDRIARRFFHWAVDRENTRGRSFMTVHHRPRTANEIGTWSEPAISGSRSAVVLQGPIYAPDNFTLETLRLYARTMPGTQLILSTWDDTDAALLAPIRDLGVTVVLNEKPAFAGPFNVNMQIASASSGVRRAVADGAEWVMKTRTDQRLYAPDAINFLIALAQAFPVGGSTAQKHRIIGVGLGSLKFAPHHVTDQTLFGAADDMLAYWTPPLRQPDEANAVSGDAAVLFENETVGDLCRTAAAESYLTSQFLLRLGRPVEWTLVDTWAAYRDHFCFADMSATDFYWVKGQTYSQREHTFVYDKMSNRAEMTFRDWLLLYRGHYLPADAKRYERVLQTRYNEAVPVE